jgi:hypothetical protein
MDLAISDINYLAVVAGVVMNMIVGGLWYSPLLFAKPWMAETGINMDAISEDKAGMIRGYVVSVIASIAIVFAMSVLVEATDASGVTDGLLIGLLAGIGFVATTQAANYTFESRTLRVYAINVGYPVSSFLAIGLLLALWR